MQPNWSIGIDIGGTFTDIVAVDAVSGRRVDAKVLTTATDPLDGILDALAVIRRDHGVAIEDGSEVIHATTLAINTVIERKGADVGMVTTEGFRDVIEIGREDRYDLYDLQLELPSPLVVRERRVGVRERTTADGQVRTELDEASLDAALAALGPVDAIAVCFLNSFRNAANEEAAVALIRAARPDVYVCASADVAPIIREYERFTAGTMNAYVGPRLASYLRALTSALAQRGFDGTVGIMKSDGGMFSPEAAAGHPVRVLESGPAAGILSAAYTATQIGERRAVAFDMGGTTAKACLVSDGEPALTEELDVARLDRTAPGSGLPVRVPSLDLIEIGAGGGSIAWIDGLGIMQVGPESAGSEPGPACYAQGGKRPTVTDADVLLGYLMPDRFAGGAMTLDPTLAEQAIKDDILEVTGTSDVTAAAWGVHDIVNENMARVARLHCLDHGIDPSSASLVATGGAGPVHAAGVVAKLGASRVIYPPSAGVASAFGLLLAPRTVDRTVTELCLLSSISDADLGDRVQRLTEALRADEDAPGGTMAVWLSIRLRGQGYELTVRVPETPTAGDVTAAFEQEYVARFGRSPYTLDAEIVEWTARLTWDREPPKVGDHDGAATSAAGTTRAYFGPDHGWLETRVVDRATLRQEGRVPGPLLIPEDGSTVVFGPQAVASIDERGNVVVEFVTDTTTAETAAEMEVA